VTWFLGGWDRLRVLRFPIALLLLMIPIPDIIFNRVAFPLQLVASSLGETTLSAAGLPVLREGNLIVLPNMTLEVAEACSGIRSLVALFTLAVVYGYMAESESRIRILLLASTIPIAIAVNGLRVAMTGLAANHYGAAAAEGFVHSTSGWVMFLVAGAAMVAVRLLLRLAFALFRSRGESPRVDQGTTA
jgi:exosortase